MSNENIFKDPSLYVLDQGLEAITYISCFLVLQTVPKAMSFSFWNRFLINVEISKSKTGFLVIDLLPTGFKTCSTSYRPFSHRDLPMLFLSSGLHEYVQGKFII